MSENNKPSKFGNIIELLRVTLWPLIIIILIIIYSNDVSRLVRILPEKVERSSKISVGSLSLEIQELATDSGNAELGKLINNLSEDAIYLLITSGGSMRLLASTGAFDGTNPGVYLTAEINGYSELYKAGLLDASEPVEELQNFFESFKPSTHKIYKFSDNSYTYKRINPEQKEVVQRYIPLTKLSDSQLNRFRTANVALNENGRKALNIIVKVIAKSISTDAIR